MLLSEEKRAEALRILSELYPNPRPELHFTSPYELLVAVMLSAQCTDKQVNKVTAELFRVANTPEQMMALDEDRLMELIHSCGFFRMKGKHILETSRILVEKYGGEVPADRDVLTELPGVGRKTANVVVHPGHRRGHPCVPGQQPDRPRGRQDRGEDRAAAHGAHPGAGLDRRPPLDHLPRAPGLRRPAAQVRGMRVEPSL